MVAGSGAPPHQGLAGVRAWVPTLITLATLSFGFLALGAAHLGEWTQALLLILAAGLADGLDGAAARKLGVTSALGEQLDSLADIVAFGVAPAFLFATVHAQAPVLLRGVVAIGFVQAGAFRLARFHSLPAGTTFCGLPITAAGVMLAAAVAGPFALSAESSGIVAALLSVLMVCKVRFPKLGALGNVLAPVALGAAALLLLFASVQVAATVAAVALSLYVVVVVLAGGLARLQTLRGAQQAANSARDAQVH